MNSFEPVYIHVPTPDLSRGERTEFASLLAAALHETRGPVPWVRYSSSYPKHEFLHYVVEHEHLLLHGSARPNIELLEPRAESENSGRLIYAVFAASDALWPLFFAILDRKPYPFSVHNGCRRVPDGKVYYFSTSTLHDHPWVDGTMYILPRESFEPFADEDEGSTDQWPVSYTHLRAHET